MPRPSNAGFALIAVLWVLAALSALTAVGLATARVGSMTTRNRIVLSRAAWAREACIDILRARFARDTMTLQVSKTDLGRGTWCTAKLEDPSGKVDVNRADRPTIERLMLNMGVQPSVAESILTIRRRARIYDVTQIPGVDSALAARLARYWRHCPVCLPRQLRLCCHSEPRSDLLLVQMILQGGSQSLDARRCMPTMNPSRLGLFFHRPT